MDLNQIKHLYKRTTHSDIHVTSFQIQRHDMKLIFASFQIAGTSRRSRVHIHTALLSTGIKNNFHEAFMCPAHLGRTQIASVTYAMAHVLLT